MADLHRPVMLAEAVRALKPAGGGIFVDGTVGAGGHATAILEASSPDGRLLGLDRDPQAIEAARRRLEPFAERVELVCATFDQLGGLLPGRAPGGVDGILLDLGVSSMQLDGAERGFSFRLSGPLDMRMSRNGRSANDILAESGEAELTKIFARLGEEPFAARVARHLVKARQKEAITTTARLAGLVEEALPFAVRKRKIHPATKVFMALRLAVNDELGQLERFLEEAPSWLKPGGRLAIISYHSLEDRRVKRAFNAFAHPCTCPPEFPVCVCGKKPLFTLAGKKAQRPTAGEVEENPRARSARLRAAVRTAEGIS